MPSNEELQADFSTWCAAYAYKKDPDTVPVFTIHKDQNVYAINSWGHSSPQPSIADLLALDDADKTHYQNLHAIDTFFAQADTRLKAGYLLLWKRIRQAEGETPDDIFADLRSALLTRLV